MKTFIPARTALAVMSYSSVAFVQSDNSFNPRISLMLDGTYAKPPVY